ncbi:hypothetical protein ABEB36_007080 [Hypothenemus hampei]|uniref:Uncharacterized protein n=1 Tax=Hypothenemus hampei TaxID=57062 RepID=A0ABD1ESS9_HYPHA
MFGSEKLQLGQIPNTISQLFNTQWSKLSLSSTSPSSSLTKSSPNRLNQLLEDEYETLLREIDYLTTEKTCYFNNKNDQLTLRRSDEDVSDILQEHSKEMLQNYVEQQKKEVNHERAKEQSNMVNYITKITVSRPKCNRTLCKCKPQELPSQKIQEPQTTSFKEYKSLKKPASYYKTIGISPPKQDSNKELSQSYQKISKEFDHWLQQKISASKEYPKTTPSLLEILPIEDPSRFLQESQLRISSKENKLKKDVSILNTVSTCNKKIMSNCHNETIEAQTSTDRMCLPNNFEDLQKSGKQIGVCTKKKNCNCDICDSKEAIKRDVALLRREVCIQKSPKKLTISSRFSNIVTKCFGLMKRSKKREEYCESTIQKNHSIQTVPIEKVNRIEQASYEVDQNSVHTSTGTEASVQVSKTDLHKTFHEDQEVFLKESKGTAPSKENLTSSEQSDRKDVCNKCGRKKKNCDSECENLIIAPNIKDSDNDIPIKEIDSLKMIIQNQSNDNHRQFDTIIGELSQQKNEIQRLNSMYQKMVDNFYDSQKSVPNENSGIHELECGIQTSCGCAFENQCQDSNQKSQVIEQPTKTYGPVNTTVSINFCDTCTVGISSPTSKNNSFSAHWDSDKQRKDELNHSERIIEQSLKYNEGDSLSMIFKNEPFKEFSVYGNSIENVQKNDEEKCRYDNHALNQLTKKEEKNNKNQLQFEARVLNFCHEITVGAWKMHFPNRI